MLERVMEVVGEVGREGLTSMLRVLGKLVFIPREEVQIVVLRRGMELAGVFTSEEAGQVKPYTLNQVKP